MFPYSARLAGNRNREERLVLKLLFEGANGSTTITDSSPRKKTGITCNGTAAISTAQFTGSGSTSSLSCPARTDTVSLPTNSEFTFKGDFVISVDVYPTVLLPTLWCVLDMRSSGGTSAQFKVGMSNVSSTYRPHLFAPGLVTLTGTSTSIPLNQWTNLKVRRVGTAVQLLVNDTVDATSGTSSATLAGGSNPIIGDKDNGGTGYGIQGYIDNLVIVNGISFVPT